MQTCHSCGRKQCSCHSLTNSTDNNKCNNAYTGHCCWQQIFNVANIIVRSPTRVVMSLLFCNAFGVQKRGLYAKKKKKLMSKLVWNVKQHRDVGSANMLIHLGILIRPQNLCEIYIKPSFSSKASISRKFVESGLCQRVMAILNSVNAGWTDIHHTA